jgi:hypothetical protein
MPALWAAMATGPDWQAAALGRKTGPSLFMCFIISFQFKIFRNLLKLLNYIENKEKLRKI